MNILNKNKRYTYSQDLCTSEQRSPRNHVPLQIRNNTLQTTFFGGLIDKSNSEL